MLVIFVAIFIASSAISAGASSAEQTSLVVLHPEKIYYGNAKKSRRAAVLKLKKVYKHLAAYKRLQAEGLKKSDARYHILLLQATKELRKVLTRIAREKRYDLFAEVGAIRTKGKPPPDITALVIKKLKATP